MIADICNTKMPRRAPPGAQKAFNLQKMKEREKMMREKQRKEREEASEFCSDLFSKRSEVTCVWSVVVWECTVERLSRWWECFGLVSANNVETQ